MSTESDTPAPQSAPAGEAPAAEAPAAAPPAEPAPQPRNEVGAQLAALIQAEADKRSAEAQRTQQSQAQQQALDMIRLAKSDPEGFAAVVRGEPRKPKQQKNDLSAVTSQIAELQAQLAQQREREQTFVQQAQMERVRHGVRSFVEQSDAFPLVKSAGLADDVYQVLVHHHNEGRNISEEEAARLVEAHVEQLVDKAMQVEAIRKKYTTAPSAPADPTSISLSTLEAPRTVDTSDPKRPLSPEERRAELLAAIAQASQ